MSKYKIHDLVVDWKIQIPWWWGHRWSSKLLEDLFT